MGFYRVTTIMCCLKKDDSNIVETIKRKMEKSCKVLKINPKGLDVLNEDDNTGSGIVVITDDEGISSILKGTAIIGIENEEKINGIDYVVQSCDGIDREYIELVYARKKNLPQIIGITQRSIIREITIGDVEELYLVYENIPDDYVTSLKDYDTELEIAEAYINNMYRFYGYGMWVIEDALLHRVIGRVGFEHREIYGETYVELGYVIHSQYQGKGYGYEAACEAIRAGKKLGLEEIILCANKKNLPSIKLAQKLGFKLWKEAVIDNQDVLVYKLLIF